MQKWNEDPTIPGTAILQLEIDYKYDAFDNRIQKSVDDDGLGGDPALATRFAYDGWNPAKAAPIGRENFDVWAHFDGNGTLTTRYEYADKVDSQLARLDQTQTEIETTTTVLTVDGGVTTTMVYTSTAYTTTTDVRYLLSDYQGSVRDVIDETAAVKDSIKYDAFGKITSETNSAERGWYAYTGREIEKEIDLQYNHARWYNPQLQKWMGEDRLGFDAGDSNLYRYVINNPNLSSDPSGLALQWASVAGERNDCKSTVVFVENSINVTTIVKAVTIRQTQTFTIPIFGKKITVSAPSIYRGNNTGGPGGARIGKIEFFATEMRFPGRYVATLEIALRIQPKPDLLITS